MEKLARKPRGEMIAETRAKLIAAARQAFGTVGYAEASMDDLTAAAGLTRGALYHHFGGKEGLLRAVVAEINAEMSARLHEVSSKGPTRWEGFVAECVAYVEMALEPEIQRIILCDRPAVLGDPSKWPDEDDCIGAMSHNIKLLAEEGTIHAVDPVAAAQMIYGTTLYAAFFIANADDPKAASLKSVEALKALLNGLLVKPVINRPA